MVPSIMSFFASTPFLILKIVNITFEADERTTQASIVLSLIFEAISYSFIRLCCKMSSCTVRNVPLLYIYNIINNNMILLLSRH